MSDIVTTATLRARVRRDTGFTGSSYTTDADLTDDILRAARELEDELITIGQEFERTTVTVTTVPGVASYNLPIDFYRLLAVHVTTSGGTFFRAEPFEFGELEGLLNQGTTISNEFGKYRLGGAFGVVPTETIEWAPTPTFARSFRVDYVPSPTFPLDGGEHNLRSHGPAWEEFIVADAGARLLEREKADASAFYQRRENARARIKRRAPTRDASPVRPARTRDFYGFSRPRRPWDRRTW